MWFFQVQCLYGGGYRRDGNFFIYCWWFLSLMLRNNSVCTEGILRMPSYLRMGTLYWEESSPFTVAGGTV